MLITVGCTVPCSCLPFALVSHASSSVVKVALLRAPIQVSLYLCVCVSVHQLAQLTCCIQRCQHLGHAFVQQRWSLRQNALYPRTHISHTGGHLNPAISLAFLLAKKITAQRFLCYVIAQLAGAITGSALVFAVRSLQLDRADTLHVECLST